MEGIKKIKVSELPLEEDGKGFWLFGYNRVGDENVSRRLSYDKLQQIVDKAVEDIQLERRIAVVFETLEQLVPVGEKMTVTKLVQRNIQKIEFRENTANKEWKELQVGETFMGNADITLRIIPRKDSAAGSFEDYSTITIFTKKEKI